MTGPTSGSGIDGGFDDEVEGGVVNLAVQGPEEVGNTQVAVVVLAWEREPHALSGSGLVLPDDEFVAIPVGGEIPVHQLGHQEVVGPCPGETLPQERPQPILEFGIGLSGLRPVLPLIAEQGCFIQVGGDVVDGNALHHAAAEEGRHKDLVVGNHRGSPGWESRSTSG